jgi:cytochrome oxidase assembly protein ShyY1
VYRFLFTRQWVFLTLLGLALIPAMIKLGFWQLHRHESRVAHNHLITRSLGARTVPVDRLTGVHREPRTNDQYRQVSATGRYDTRDEVVVRQRTDNDGQTIGYFLVTPLIRHDGTTVLVNRGWIPANGDLTKFPKVPPTPRGTVTVKGRILADETSAASGIKDTKGLPAHQVMLINSHQQTKALKRPVLGGYLQLTKTSPKGALPHGKQPQRITPPDHSSIGPHMAYTIQWWLFTAAVPVGWIILVRRERGDRLAAAAEKGNAAPHSGGDGDGQDRSGDGSQDGSGNADGAVEGQSGGEHRTEATATAGGSRPGN